MVRCKYKCTEVRKSVAWNDSRKFLYVAEFRIVTDGSEENKKFFEATPSGQLTIGTYKEDHFIPGKEYYLDITECEVKNG